MPKKMLPAAAVPTLVQERLRMWGSCIRKQRILQKIRIEDLCARIGVSDPTLRRMENGDPRSSIALYLSALYVLGMLDAVAPPPPAVLWGETQRKRARPAAGEVDDDDF